MAAPRGAPARRDPAAHRVVAGDRAADRLGGGGAQRRRDAVHAAAVQRRARNGLRPTRCRANLPVAIGLTLWRALAGFFISAVVGIALGIAMARMRLFYWFFDPIISIGFPIPKIAFLPIIVLWLGFFDVSKITMIVFNSIFPVVTATVVGVYGVEKELIWSARNLGTSEQALTVGGSAAGRAAADLHRAAGRVADRADRRHPDRDGDGRLRHRRQHADRVTLRRFARRIRRHHRDRGGRLRAGQVDERCCAPGCWSGIRRRSSRRRCERAAADNPHPI